MKPIKFYLLIFGWIFLVLFFSFQMLYSGNRITSTVTKPDGSNGNVQFNDNGSFGADSTFTYNDSTNQLAVSSISATNISVSSITIGNQNLNLSNIGYLSENQVWTGTNTHTNPIFINSNFGVGKSSQSNITRGVFISSTGTDLSIVSSVLNPLDGPQIQVVNISSGVFNGYRFLSFRINAGATEVGNIATDGASTISYNTSSDYRLKQNLNLFHNAIDKVLNIPVYSFTFKTDPLQRANVGFLAHEVQQVMPTIVIGEKDAVYSNGDPKYQQIDYSKLVPLLTAAIQEQQKIIEEYELRIRNIESMLGL